MDFSTKWLNRSGSNQEIHSQYSQKDQQPDYCEYCEPNSKSDALEKSPTSEEKHLTERMQAHPHLAPCPRRRGHWVYRGQACVKCGKKSVCPSWLVHGIEFSVRLPSNIPRPNFDDDQT